MKLAQLQFMPRFWTSLPIHYRGIGILAIPTLCLLAALIVFGSFKEAIAEDKRLVQQTKQIKLETKRLLIGLSRAEAGYQGYGLTRKRSFLKSYQEAIANIPSALERLRQLVQNNPKQYDQFKEIEQLIDQSLVQLQQKLSTFGNDVQAVEPLTVYQWLQEDDLILAQTRQRIQQLVEEEEMRLEQFQINLETQQQRGWILLWGLVAISTVSVILAVGLLHQLSQELVERESQLQEVNKQLNRVNDRLQQFTSDASHELRAPLAGIQGHAQAGLLAPDEDLTAPRYRLEKIAGITKSMSTLIGNLLFLARHEGLQTAYSPPIDLVALLAEVTNEYTIAATDRQLHFSYHTPDFPILVKVNPDLCQQAIANLLNNALQYTPAGGNIQLRLSVQASTAQIQVEDTGIGIPESDLPFIFERFYRVDRVRTKTGGFGLGLAIVQQIIQSYGGQVTVSSTVGQGSTFQIELPLA